MQTDSDTPKGIKQTCKIAALYNEITIIILKTTLKRTVKKADAQKALI